MKYLVYTQHIVILKKVRCLAQCRYFKKAYSLLLFLWLLLIFLVRLQNTMPSYSPLGPWNIQFLRF